MTVPATKVNVMAVALARLVHAVVWSTHVAVPPQVIVLALEESTALKYFGCKAMVIVPATGTAVTVVKPRDTASFGLFRS